MNECIGVGDGIVSGDGGDGEARHEEKAGGFDECDEGDDDDDSLRNDGDHYKHQERHHHSSSSVISSRNESKVQVNVELYLIMYFEYNITRYRAYMKCSPAK